MPRKSAVSGNPAQLNNVASTTFLEGMTGEETQTLHRLAKKVFSSPERFGFPSCDEAAEAFLRYPERMRTIIRKGLRIQINGDIYMESCMRFLAKSLQRTARKREMMNFVLESSGESETENLPGAKTSFSPEDTADEVERSRFISGITPAVFISKMSAQQKRLLFLVVKCAWEIRDDMLDKSAWRLGVPPTWLEAIVHRARASIEPARLQFQKTNEKINALWVRMRLIEYQLKNENAKDEARGKLLHSAELCRARYFSLLEKKARCRLLVPNKEVAEILHIPKGSVDSGIYYLKENARNDLEAFR
jgi:hypothetical protein